MSLFSALSVSLAGLQTATSQMQLVASNISNADKDGYSRKSARLDAVILGDDTGGVRISGYDRVTDAATLSALRSASSEEGLYSQQSDLMDRVQETLGLNTNNPELSNAIDEFASTWRLLNASPESSVQQRQVVRAGTRLTTIVQNLSNAIEDLDRTVRIEIDTTIATLNTSLKKVEYYNAKISSALSMGQAVGDLEDARDAAVLEIAEITSVKTMQRDNGRIALYTPQGYLLLDGEARSFLYDGTNLTTTDSPGAPFLNDVIIGGKLEAGIRFRSDSSPAVASSNPAFEVIRKLRSQLDAVAAAFTTSAAGPPETFAHAYNPTGVAATAFFTGTDRTNFAVNIGLETGATPLTTTQSAAVVDSLNNTGRTFTADGLSLTGGSYESLGADLLAVFQQSTNEVRALAEPASEQKTFLSKKYNHNIGVNVDTELIAITTLQNAYNASARVISIINEMLDTLDSIMG